MRIRRLLLGVLACIAVALAVPVASSSYVYAAEVDPQEEETETLPDPPPPKEEPTTKAEEAEPEEPEVEIVYIPVWPDVVTYNPDVTALHSLNAWFAATEEAAPTGVYFLPYLDDFPVSLEDTAAYVVDGNGEEHRFAAVYSGYFDTEVAYVRPDDAANKDAANLTTSKKVYSTTDNTRTLQMLGYDLLLTEERADIYSSNGSLYAAYHPSLVNSGPLTAQTVIMDVYKALGQYEWDIQLAWTKDDDLNLNNSPIQQQINVLTNHDDAGEGEEGAAKGIDTAEGSTWVWATRTNPNLYWDRCRKDVIFSGGAHNVTTAADSTVGGDVAVSFAKGPMDTVTFGEFCAITRAMMHLYGESVMTEEERLIMLQAYALNIPKCTSLEITEAVEYLAAKGIIDPSKISIDKNVTFADIEPILCRIADQGSRLTFKSIVYDTSSELFQRGYVETKIRDSGVDLLGIEEVANPDYTLYNDYFIESADGHTNFILASDDSHGSKGSAIAGGILCNGVSGITDRVFLNQGCTEDGYYHFKIASNVSSAYISYDVSDGTELLNGTYVTEEGVELHGITGYDIPIMGGGVYTISDSGEWTRRTFDEAGWTSEYLDDERRASFDGKYNAYLNDDMHWYNIAIEYSSDAELATIWQSSMLTESSGVKYTLDAVNDLEIGDTSPLYVNPTTNNTIIPSYWWRNEDTESANGNKIANYTVQVSDSKDVFLNSLSLSNASIASQTASDTDTCFYNMNGSLLVSFDFLKKKGLATSLVDLPSGEGHILTTSSGSPGNVILLPGTGRILVGNTLFNAGDELLVHDINGTKYINYRACIGWTSRLLCISNNGVLSAYEQGTARDYTLRNGLGYISVTTMFPKASTSVGTYYDRESDYEYGIRMTSTYPLSNYLVVMTDGTVSAGDVLFVARKRKITLNGTEVDLGDDSESRSLFEQMTGFSLSGVPDLYHISATPLDRNDRDGVGMDYVEIPANNANGQTAITVGYVYYPTKYDDARKSLEHIAVPSSENLIPIVKAGHSMRDMNMNTFSFGDMAPLEDYGTLPYMFHTGSKSHKNVAGRINAEGTVEAVFDVYADGAAETVVVYPAPVATFLVAIKGVEVPLKTVFSSKSLVYYGSSKCVVSKVPTGFALTLGGLIVTYDNDKSCYRVFTGTSASSIYALSDTQVGINTEVDALDNAISEISAILKDVEGIVDWEKYTFNRLVSEADRLTSILIIFALAILPRVAIFLFLILMTLALIKDFVPWRNFCRSVFDIYKLITFGKQTVDTVSMKKMFFYSLFAQALFVMIMDGALFNFIEWVSVFFFTAAQR